MMAVILTACVQPIPPSPTPIPPTPTIYLSPTPLPPPDDTPTFPPSMIAGWLQQYLSVTAHDLTLFMQFQIGSDNLYDDIVGYTFQDENGQFCAGFAQTIAATATVLTADYRCAPLGTPVIIGWIPFALLNGDFYQAVYGYIDPNSSPSASAIAVEFPDGNSLNQMLISGGFVLLRPQQFDAPIQLTVMDAGGYTVTIVPLR